MLDQIKAIEKEYAQLTGKLLLTAKIYATCTVPCLW